MSPPRLPFDSSFRADPTVAPTPLPSGPALVRHAALALAIGLAGCGDDDDGAVPMTPPDMGAPDMIAPMPPPQDLGADDLGTVPPMPEPDMGAEDLGFIPPMPPPRDMGLADLGADDLGADDLGPPVPPMPPPPPPMPPPMPPPPMPAPE